MAQHQSLAKSRKPGSLKGSAAERDSPVADDPELDAVLLPIASQLNVVHLLRAVGLVPASRHAHKLAVPSAGHEQASMTGDVHVAIDAQTSDD